MCSKSWNNTCFKESKLIELFLRHRTNSNPHRSCRGSSTQLYLQTLLELISFQVTIQLVRPMPNTCAARKRFPMYIASTR